MQKISIITSGGKTNKVEERQQTPYFRVYVLVKEQEIEKIPGNRIVFLTYSNENERRGIIKKLINEKKNELIIPYFRGDDYSKYTIYTHNQYASNNIDRKIFKHKHKMNEFIGSNKKACHLTFEDLRKQSYFSLKEMLGEEMFIIKPINKSASAGAFKIQSQEDWNDIQSKLLHCDHVIEEYYQGHLHSVDFYFDGEHVLVLCMVREVPFIEIMDEKKHSTEFLERYGEEINKHFLYFLPIRYDVAYNKIHDAEWKFIETLGLKLKHIGYKGFIHLEYKFDRATQKVGFIEWGARLGGHRVDWIKKLHYFDTKTLLFDIYNNDISKRKPYKGSYIFKDIAPNLHYIGMYKNFVKKAHIGEVLTKHKDYMKISLEEYIKMYFQKIEVSIKNLKIITSKDKYFYPSYQGGSYFKIQFEVDDENFRKFKSKKIKIIEDLVF